MRYDWVQSSTVRCLEPGPYTMRVMLINDEQGSMRLDRIDLVERPDPEPVASVSWGRVKALYH